MSVFKDSGIHKGPDIYKTGAGTSIVKGSFLETLVNDYEIHKGIVCDQERLFIDLLPYNLYTQDVEFFIDYKLRDGVIFNASMSYPPPMFQTLNGPEMIGFWFYAYSERGSFPDFVLANYGRRTTGSSSFTLSNRHLNVWVKNSEAYVKDVDLNTTLWSVNDIPFQDEKVRFLYPFITRPNVDPYPEYRKSIFYNATVKKNGYTLMNFVPAKKLSNNRNGILDVSTMIFYEMRPTSFIDD